MSDRAARTDRWLPWVFAAVGFAFDIAAAYPGLLSHDGAYAWWQARGGETTDITSPLMIDVWRALDAIVDGPGALFVLHLVLFWSGLALIARGLVLNTRATFALFLVAGAAPLIALLRMHVLTDVGFFCALACACGALACYARDARRRWLVLAGATLFYAAGLRHNALPAIVPLLVWACALALRARREAGATSMTRIALASIGASVLLFGSIALVNARVDRHIAIWPALAQWDLAAISIASDEMLLPAGTVGDGMDVPDLAQAFVPWSNLPLLVGTRHGIRAALSPDWPDVDLAQLRQSWFDAILAHPRAYLAHRARVSVALFGTRERAWPVELTYVDGETAYRDNPPIAPNRSALHVTLIGLAERARDTFVLSAWPYLLIGVLVAPIAWRRRATPQGTLAVALLTSAWLHAAPLTVLAPSAEVRYLGWSALASLVAAVVAFAAPRSVGR